MRVVKRLAFLGPAGSYTEEAALKYDTNATLVPFTSNSTVASAVEAGLADAGVVPIENSLEGSVTDTLDLLIHESNLFISDELVLPIHHSLLAAERTETKDIKVIYSHPQALGQCRSFLAKRFPQVELVASLSTSAAVQEMLAQGPGGAALANQRAGALYGAKLLEQRIEDNPNNLTRFVVLAKSDGEPTGTDKTSICFSFDGDAPGLLYRVMGEFSNRGINLAKVESRPTKQSLGRYIFLIDLLGHREDKTIREALADVESQVSTLRIFGSYPQYSAGNPLD